MDTTLTEFYLVGAVLFALGATTILMSIIPTKDGTTLFQPATTEIFINSAIPAFFGGLFILYLSFHWGLLNSYYPSMISSKPAAEWGGLTKDSDVVK